VGLGWNTDWPLDTERILSAKPVSAEALLIVEPVGVLCIPAYQAAISAAVMSSIARSAQAGRIVSWSSFA